MGKITVDENWTFNKNGIHDAIKNNIPSKFTKTKHNLPWVTSEIKRQMRKKERIHRSMKKNPSKPCICVLFKSQHNKVIKLISAAFDRYINRIIGASLAENPKK